MFLTNFVKVLSWHNAEAFFSEPKLAAGRRAFAGFKIGLSGRKSGLSLFSRSDHRSSRWFSTVGNRVHRSSIILFLLSVRGCTLCPDKTENIHKVSKTVSATLTERCVHVPTPSSNTKTTPEKYPKSTCHILCAKTSINLATNVPQNLFSLTPLLPLPPILMKASWMLPREKTETCSFH